jgi:hypothetical protein
MEKTEELRLFRLRSSGAAIVDGYRLYMSNFRRLFRSSWVVAIGYALSVCAFTMAFISFMPNMVIAQNLYGSWAAMTNMGVLPIWMLVASILSLVATTAMAAHGYTAMSEHQATDEISIPRKWYGHISRSILQRTFAATLLMLLYAILIEWIMVGICWAGTKYLGTITGLALLCVMGLIIFALSVPLAFSITKYILTPKVSFFHNLAQTYGIGLRHWGGLFVVTLTTQIITLVFSFATELPAFILGMANMSSQMGTLQGDPAGMPGYMGWMTFIVLSIAGFVQAYILLASMFPFYYLYGSIETQENERKQIDQTT